MGDCIGSSRSKVVPTLEEGHLAFIKNQSPNETCVSMSIGYMLYVFLMKYYVKETENVKQDIQEIILDYLVKAFHNGVPTNSIAGDMIMSMCETIATAFGCKALQGVNDSFDNLKKFLKTHNTIHCCMILCPPDPKNNKFYDFFKNGNSKPYTSGEAAKIVATSTIGGHAMVALDCNKCVSGSMVRGANSWGYAFGSNGYWTADWNEMKFDPPIFTFQKKGKMPSEFVLPAMKKAAKKTITASDLIGNTVVVTVPWDFTVGQVKQAIADQVGVKKSNIDLLYRQKVVTDDMTKQDIDYNPLIKFRIIYHSYDNSKQRVTLDGKNFVVPNIYTIHGAHPLTHKIFAHKHAVSFMVHNPNKKTVSYYGPFYNVPDGYNCNQISGYLKKHHNLSFNFNGGVFFKENPYSGKWLKIKPDFALKHQIRFLGGTSYVVLNVQQ